MKQTVVGALVAAAILAVVGFACSSADPTPETAGETWPSTAEDVVSPADGPTADSEQDGYLGVIIAREEVDLAFEVEGRLESVQVRLGDQVDTGDVIGSLKTEDISEQLEIARASVQVARAAVKQLEIEARESAARYERVASLDEVVSDEDRTAARAKRQVADAALEVARARLAEQEAALGRWQGVLSRAVLRAPFAGTVSTRYHDPGAMLGPGQPIVRINSNELWVRFAVSEQDIDKVRLGTPIVVGIEALGFEPEGIVAHVAPHVDPAAHLILVEGRLEIPEARGRRVQAGLVGRVRLVPRATTPDDASLPPA